MLRATRLALVPVLIFVQGWCIMAAQETHNSNEPSVRVKETIVFDGDKGWEHEGVTYRPACGAAIAAMPNGDMLCWWAVALTRTSYKSVFRRQENL